MAATSTTKRTTTKPAAAPPDYDFDSWTEEDDEKAIAALVPDVKHIIVEKRFIGRFTDGKIVELPLTLSLDDVDTLSTSNEATVDQFRGLLRSIGGDEVAAEFGRHDLAETTILSQKYFTILQRVQQAGFPES